MKFSLKHFDKGIMFNRSFVDITGSVTSALLLSQAVYWQLRHHKEDGWWAKSRDEWTSETGMKRAELEGARERCAQFLSVQKRGVPATNYYRVNTLAIEAALELHEQQKDVAECQQDGGKPANWQAENPPTSLTKEKKEKGASPPSAPKREFTDRWCEEYLKTNGKRYIFQGAKDGKAADRIIDSKIPLEEFFKIARAAWAASDQKLMWCCCSQSHELSSFWSCWNKIRREIEGATARPVQRSSMLGYTSVSGPPSY